MNKRQLVVMWVGIVIFVLFGLCTRTQYTRKNIIRNGGNIKFGHDSYVIDYGPLVVRLGSTALVTATLIYTLKDKKDN